MIFTNTDRQGFNKALTGVIGSSIQSVYAKPVGDPSLLADNASWKYPLGDPWGWSIYPWNWGKEGEADKVAPTPDDSSPETKAMPWKGAAETGNTVVIFAAVIGAIWFLSSKTKLLSR